MGDDITIGVTEIVNNIEVTAQPNDQIVDISVIDNADDVTLNITPTVIEINVNKGSSYAKWGTILGTLSDQTDLQNALDLKANLVGGKVPASELPSYVDDVVEVANYAALPTTGETGKIYVTLDNNKIYRWSGSVYIEIAANNAIWGAITGTLSNQTDLQSALDAKQNTITLTTSGTTGAATLVGSTLNIPNYTTDISGLVPYTGATTNVDLGAYKLTASDLVINHASGSGVAASITKGGNGEALTVVKSSGSGNAASITGGVTLLSELHLTTDLADTYIASAATWNAKQDALSGTGFVKISGTTISYDNSTYALDNAVVHLTGAETITGEKSFNNATSSSSIFVTNSSTGNGISSFNTSTGNALYLNNNSTGKGAYINNVSSGIGLFVNNTTAATGLPFVIAKSNSNVFTINDAGEATGTKFVKSGGTSSQFLKADGSVDTNSYILSVAANAPLGSTGGTSPVISITQATTSSNGYLSSTDWNTFNNKVPTSRTLTINGTAYDLSADRSWTISAGISGSGTTNYLPKFTGSTALGNSLIYDNGTNIGIGTPSPAVNLHIKGSGSYSGIRVDNTGTTGGGYVALYQNGSQIGLFGVSGAVIGSTASDFAIFSETGKNIDFMTDGTTTPKMRINTSGNVGIGTTSPAEKLHVMGNSIFNNSSNNGTTLRFVSNSNSLYGDAFILSPFSNCIFSSNITYNSASGYVYDKNGYGASVRLSGGSTNNGDIFFNTFTSGTAGATATELNRMTILNGGNVGIGTTSPYVASGLKTLAINDSTGSIFDLMASGTTVLRQYCVTNAAVIEGVGATSITTITNGVERMRITSGGNVGIGTTSPSSRLHISSSSNTPFRMTRTGLSDYSFELGATNDLYLVNNGIGSYPLTVLQSGNIGINTITPSYTLHVNGSVAGTSAYVNLSDKRHKRDILPIENALNKILALNGVTFNWDKESTDMNLDDNNHIGLIAQDVEKIIPQAVVTAEDENKTKSVAYTDLVPVLIEAIKELKAEIEILKNK